MSERYQVVVLHPAMQLIVQQASFDSKVEAAAFAAKREGEGYLTRIAPAAQE